MPKCETVIIPCGKFFKKSLPFFFHSSIYGGERKKLLAGDKLPRILVHFHLIWEPSATFNFHHVTQKKCLIFHFFFSAWNKNLKPAPKNEKHHLLLVYGHMSPSYHHEYVKHANIGEPNSLKDNLHSTPGKNMIKLSFFLRWSPPEKNFFFFLLHKIIFFGASVCKCFCVSLLSFFFASLFIFIIWTEHKK